jgi:hypothetical protein
VGPDDWDELTSAAQARPTFVGSLPRDRLLALVPCCAARSTTSGDAQQTCPSLPPKGTDPRPAAFSPAKMTFCGARRGPWRVHDGPLEAARRGKLWASLGRQPRWWARLIPPLWQYLGAPNQKALAAMCAPKGVGPRHLRHFSCKEATSKVRKRGRKVPIMDPCSAAAGALCARSWGRRSCPLWQYLFPP